MASRKVRPFASHLGGPSSARAKAVNSSAPPRDVRGSVPRLGRGRALGCHQLSLSLPPPDAVGVAHGRVGTRAQVAVTFLGTVAVGPLQLDASSAACPSAAGSPLLALTLHLLYLTLADWCTEKVSEHAEMNKPSSELPLLPRCGSAPRSPPIQITTTVSSVARFGHSAL
jgi:hypothetical protein